MRTSSFLLPTIAGAMLLQSATSEAIILEKVVSTSDKKAYLDIYADTEGETLRSFGINIAYDKKALSAQQITRYAGLWFFTNEKGERIPQTEVSQNSDGSITIVGGRYEMEHPKSGVNGSRVLLASIAFDRENSNTPTFEIDLAHEAPFTNFSSISNDDLDKSVEGRGNSVSIQKLSEDSDSDGIPDDDEMRLFDSLDVSSGATSDTDKDGINDYDEWLAGTDPNDASSKFEIEIIPQKNGEMMVQWTSAENRYYELQVCTDLKDFGTMMSGINGEKEDIAIMIPDAGNKQEFYRIQIEHPTAGR